MTIANFNALVFLSDFIESVSSNILPIRKPRDWPASLKIKGTIRQAINPFVIVQNVNIYGTSNTFNSTLEISMCFLKRESVRTTRELVDSK